MAVALTGRHDGIYHGFGRNHPVNAHFTLGRQIGDFLTYILLPLCCVVLPYRWGQALILQVARRGWLLQSRSELALQQAQRFVPIDDPVLWQQQWRLVELMEARDLWLAVAGRSNSIRKRVRVDPMPVARVGLVLLGLHHGPTAIVLQIFREAGLGPRFVYRGIGAEVRRLVPFQWLYSKLNVRYIRQSCGGREISVPGARGKLESALGEEGTPVILLDAPVTRGGNSIHADVIGLDTEFSGEGPQLLVDGHAECVHYWMEVDEAGERRLHFSPASRPASAQQLVRQYAGVMSAALHANSAHWRLWFAADQLFRSNRRANPLDEVPG
jgi:hypothetical protein